VGVGSSGDAYTATQRAVAASGQFPSGAIAGRTVIIKSNLVDYRPASTGTTTQVVRALVDLALEAGVMSILVAEGAVGAHTVPFSGPLLGEPVTMNLGIAGANQVAVDRVGLQIMQVSQNGVPHLTYAALRGLGPINLTNVSILGDSYKTYPFAPAHTAPIVWRPGVSRRRSLQRLDKRRPLPMEFRMRVLPVSRSFWIAIPAQESRR
jgi:uncharacterized protein (DUF362 family)